MTHNRPELCGKGWRKEVDTWEHIVWRYKKKLNITVEAHIYSVEPDDSLTWYVYGALGGTAVQSTPRIVKGKAKAIRIVASLKKIFEKYGIEGWGGKYRDI